MRPATVLQRSGNIETGGPAEPSAAFQTHRSSHPESGHWGRRRASSNVSGGSGSFGRRMSIGRPDGPAKPYEGRRGSQVNGVFDHSTSPSETSYSKDLPPDQSPKQASHLSPIAYIVAATLSRCRSGCSGRLTSSSDVRYRDMHKPHEKGPVCARDVSGCDRGRGSYQLRAEDGVCPRPLQSQRAGGYDELEVLKSSGDLWVGPRAEANGRHHAVFSLTARDWTALMIRARIPETALRRDVRSVEMWSCLH